MDITYFRERRGGPEIAIEDAVVAWMGEHFSRGTARLWAGGSVPVGAGMPDIILATYRPQVFECTDIDSYIIQILAYLRSVPGARLDTICRRMRQPMRRVARGIDELIEMQAVTGEANFFAVTPDWRALLPEIVAIEAKVSDWKRGLAQAKRNLLFAHKSFLALPAKIAIRVITEPVFRERGIGVLAVDGENAVSVLQDGSRSKPSIWMYYYQIAAYIARNCEEK